MIVAGADEAGRGPVFGPLVIAVAVSTKETEEEFIKLGVKDSKDLTEQQRNELFDKVKELSKEFGIVKIHPPEIDSLMERLSLNEIEAMKIGSLLNNLKTKPDVVFVDSPDTIQEKFSIRIKKYSSINSTIKSEHKADSNYPIVSAASILAKVERDAEIKKIAEEFGEIGSGYPSDPKTKKFLENWLNKNEELPSFVRKKWSTTVNAIDKKYQTKL